MLKPPQLEKGKKGHRYDEWLLSGCGCKERGHCVFRINKQWYAQAAKSVYTNGIDQTVTKFGFWSALFAVQT